MKKFLRLLFVFLLSAFILSACEKEQKRDIISGSVMLYSSMDEDTLKGLKKGFETKYPGVTLDYYFSTIERVNNRLHAESNVKQFECDVVWAGSQLDFEEYKNEGYLIPYKSKEIGAIHKIFRDKENYYTGARTAAVGFGYLNDDNIKIKSYEDLLKEELKGKIAIPNPDRALIFKFFIASMMQSKKYGEDYFKKLIANDLVIESGVDTCESSVHNGKNSICFTIDYLNTSKNEEDTFTFSYPKKDVVFYYTPIGLVRDSYNPENGKLLIDYMLSKEGQNIITSNVNLSTRKDLKNVINTQKYFSKSMKIDIKDLYENIDSYVEKFNSLR